MNQQTHRPSMPEQSKPRRSFGSIIGTAPGAIVKIAASAIATVAALVTFGAPLAAHAQPAPLAMKLQNYTGGVAYLPDIAERLGYFTTNGLKVETVIVQTGPQATQALASGSVDVALVTPINVAPLLKAGRELRVAINQQPAFLNVLTQKNLAKTQWPDALTQLRGKKMAVLALGAADHGMCQTALKAAGVAPGEVTFVAAGTVQGIAAALQQGTVDSVCTNLLATAMLRAQGFPTVFSFFQPVQPVESYPAIVRSIIGLPYIQSWTRAEFVSQNPEALRRYQRSIAQAYAYIRDPANFDKFAAMLRGDPKYNIATMDDAAFRDYVKLTIAAQSVTFAPAQVATWTGIVKDFLGIDLPENAPWLAPGVPATEPELRALVAK